MPGGEIRGARVLSDGRLYVEGRLTRDRSLTWSTHPDWPYGAQWLFERRDGMWVQVGFRQTVHPHYLLTGLIGGLLTRDVAVMGRFASPQVVAETLALPPPGSPYVELHSSYAGLVADRRLTDQEVESWNALPDDVRTVPPGGPVLQEIRFFAPGNATSIATIAVRFDRDTSGWRISSIWRVSAPPSPTNELVP
jgi:hypothetical protein